jgi:hypothetical protein
MQTAIEQEAQRSSAASQHVAAGVRLGVVAQPNVVSVLAVPQHAFPIDMLVNVLAKHRGSLLNQLQQTTGRWCG